MAARPADGNRWPCRCFIPTTTTAPLSACPDPVDFHAFTTIDLYKDKNAFYAEGAHNRIVQPGMRDYLGHV